MRLLVAAFAALTLAPAAAQAVTPSNGHYRGQDFAGRAIRFDLVDGKVREFSIDSHVFVAEGLHSGNHHITITWRNATHAEGTYSYMVRNERGQLVRVTREWAAHKLVPAPPHPDVD